MVKTNVKRLNALCFFDRTKVGGSAMRGNHIKMWAGELLDTVHSIGAPLLG